MNILKKIGDVVWVKRKELKRKNIPIDTVCIYLGRKEFHNLLVDREFLSLCSVEVNVRGDRQVHFYGHPVYEVAENSHFNVVS